MFNPLRVYRHFVEKQWCYAKRYLTDLEGILYLRGGGYERKHSIVFRKILGRTIRDEGQGKLRDKENNRHSIRNTVDEVCKI